MARGKRDPETGLTAQQEQFAQEVAKGSSQSDAYRLAYPRSQKWKAEAVHVKASTLAGKVAVRIATLQAAKRTYVERKLKIDGAWVDERLIEIVERSMQHKPVLDRDGDMVYVETPNGGIAPAYTFDAKAAVAALKLLGLDLGKFAQKMRIERSPFDDLEAEMVEEIKARLALMREARLKAKVEANERPVLAG